MIKTAQILKLLGPLQAHKELTRHESENLQVLQALDGKALTAKELEKPTGMTNAALQRILARMEYAGLLTHTRRVQKNKGGGGTRVSRVWSATRKAEGFADRWAA